jgi:hypothetical protein
VKLVNIIFCLAIIVTSVVLYVINASSFSSLGMLIKLMKTEIWR